MNILVTGCSGFIGYHLSKSLLQEGFKVYGIDNLNDYYSVELKRARTERLKLHSNFIFEKFDLRERDKLDKFKNIEFETVVNLAAQAGVRHSFVDPLSYINNITSHAHVLDFAQKNKVKQFIYASTSSVYGSRNKIPFEESMTINNPTQIYSASKASCELISEAYKNMFFMNIVGLRFFTVYGEWGRPDMAFFKFLKQIKNNEPITLYNHGRHTRSFTYINDVIHYLKCVIKKSSNQEVIKEGSHTIYNVGSPDRVPLDTIISILNSRFPNKVRKQNLEFQQGDIQDTQATLIKLFQDYGEHKFTDIHEGLNNFIDWFEVYNKNL